MTRIYVPCISDYAWFIHVSRVNSQGIKIYQIKQTPNYKLFPDNFVFTNFENSICPHSFMDDGA